jgi:hypothetical protein
MHATRKFGGTGTFNLGAEQLELPALQGIHFLVFFQLLTYR